jgi:hypothetical protein
MEAITNSVSDLGRRSFDSFDVQRISDQQVNATALNPNASHAAYVSRPNQIADFILNATKGK